MDASRPTAKPTVQVDHRRVTKSISSGMAAAIRQVTCSLLKIAIQKSSHHQEIEMRVFRYCSSGTGIYSAGGNNQDFRTQQPIR